MAQSVHCLTECGQFNEMGTPSPILVIIIVVIICNCHQQQHRHQRSQPFVQDLLNDLKMKIWLKNLGPTLKQPTHPFDYFLWTK